jgi:hypothetical protein
LCIPTLCRRAVGIIDLRTAPGADDPRAPPTLAAKGTLRRAAGYPAAPELSVLPMARLKAAALPDGAGPAPGAAGQKPSSGGGGAGAFAAAPLLSDAAVLTPRGLQVASTDADAAPLGPSAAAAARPVRRLLQAAAVAAPDAGAGAAPRASLRRRAPSGRAPGAAPPAPPGFSVPAPSGPFAGAADGAGSLAASADRAVHVTGGVVHVHALLPGGALNATLAHARLQDLFAPVGSSNCADGVGEPAATYDAAARRFYLAAACGGRGSVLLAVSATPEPHGPWYLYNLNADAVGTRLACPRGEAAVVDYPRLGFNADALGLSVHGYCPSAGGGAGAPGAGAALLVLPKGAVTAGETRVAYPVFTSFEASDAAGRAVLPESILQLEPAVPQGAGDVTRGALFFVAEVRPRGVPASVPGSRRPLCPPPPPVDHPRPHDPRHTHPRIPTPRPLAQVASSKPRPRGSFLLVSVVNTGAMWGFTGDAGQVTPFMAASRVFRGDVLLPPRAANASASAAGAGEAAPEARLPPGFWSGRVSRVSAGLAGGKLACGLYRQAVDGRLSCKV